MNNGFAQVGSTLQISTDKAHEISIKTLPDNGYEIITTGSDPYLFTTGLPINLSSNEYILSFEYFCPTWLDHLEIFFAPPVNSSNSLHTELGVAEGWTIF